MKKHQIQAIAKIRKLLTDNPHTGWAMVDTVKTNRHISAFKEFIDTSIGARSFFEYAMF